MAMVRCLKVESSLEKRHLKERPNLWRRFVGMAKEKRGRLYILKRCAVMLLCWHKYGKY